MQQNKTRLREHDHLQTTSRRTITWWFVWGRLRISAQAFLSDVTSWADITRLMAE
jgi:hypothetical protein